jgi:SPP1 gp7 family putative phage head morphogenesis protein
VPTANEILQDRAIRHATYLERYKRDTAQKIIAFLNDELEPAILAKLQTRLQAIGTRGFDKSMESTKRLQELAQALKDIVGENVGEARKMVTAELRDLAKAEAVWQRDALERAVPKQVALEAKVEFLLPAPETLRAIVTEGPINGALLKDWFKGIEESTKTALTKAVNIGIASGETTQEIVSRVRGTKALGFSDGVMQATRHQINTTVSTAIAHVSGRARAATSQENADLLKGERWSSALDSRVCPYCAAQDGKVYPVGEGPRPPDSAHPACRCSVVPVLKSWKELGIEAPALPAGTRASMDGQVPGNLTFGAWLKSQPLSRIADVLGSKEAARAFMAGTVKISDFSTAYGTVLSYKQLLEKELV